MPAIMQIAITKLSDELPVSWMVKKFSATESAVSIAVQVIFNVLFIKKTPFAFLQKQSVKNIGTLQIVGLLPKQFCQKHNGPFHIVAKIANLVTKQAGLANATKQTLLQRTKYRTAGRMSPFVYAFS